MTAELPPLSPVDRMRARRLCPRAFERPPAERAVCAVAWTGFAALTPYCLWHMGFFDVARLVDGAGNLGRVLAFMLPPAHNGWLGEFLYAILETLGMAFLGTLLAALAAAILGIVGAGGIGLQLSDRIRVNNWNEACFIILLILVTVAIIDHASKAVRMRLIRA